MTATHPSGPNTTSDDRRRLREYGVWAVAVAMAGGGLAAATRAATTAVGMGELPVTLLPGGRRLAALGIPVLVTARVTAVGLTYVLTARVAPRYRLHAVAGAGLLWLLWAGWQFWVLLALT